jgi:hypothetical protein
LLDDGALRRRRARGRSRIRGGILVVCKLEIRAAGPRGGALRDVWSTRNEMADAGLEIFRRARESWCTGHPRPHLGSNCDPSIATAVHSFPPFFLCRIVLGLYIAVCQGRSNPWNPCASMRAYIWRSAHRASLVTRPNYHARFLAVSYLSDNQSIPSILLNASRRQIRGIDYPNSGHRQEAYRLKMESRVSRPPAPLKSPLTPA